MLYHYAAAVGLFIYVVIIALTLFAFLVYHMYLTSKNVTTAESMRRSDLRYNVRNMPKPTGEDVATVTAVAEASYQADLQKLKAEQAQTGVERRKNKSGTGQERAAVNAAADVVDVPRSRRFGPTTFDAMIASADARVEALEALKHNPYHLGLINNWKQVLWPPRVTL
jgi:hypothetical protein